MGGDEGCEKEVKVMTASLRTPFLHFTADDSSSTVMMKGV